MIIVEFMPILFGLSVGIPIFFFGDWDMIDSWCFNLVSRWNHILILLGLILRLVGVEYDLQKRGSL